MLRSVIFENVFNFKDHHHFVFSSSEEESNVGILVGEIGSGKSGIFELIRQCTSPSGNLTLTNLYHPNHSGYVICKFGYNKTVLDQIKKDEKAVAILKESQLDEKDISTVYSLYYRLSNEKRVARAIIVETESEGIHTYTEKVNSNRLNMLEIDLMNASAKRLTDAMSKNPQNSLVGELEELFNNFDSVAQTDFDNDYAIREQQRLCKILVEDFMVFTICQSRKGQCNKEPGTPQGRNYSEADIFELLPQEDTPDTVFEDIIGSTNYKFTRSGNEITLVDLENEERSYPLSQCPGGILQAKIISLLISHVAYFTLCLEEPDRSFHPHMIQRLREQAIKITQNAGKVILVTSHRPDWIVPKTIRNVCLCRRVNGQAKGIQVGPALFQKCNFMSFAARLDFRDVFFARRVLIVEGILEEQLVNTYFEQRAFWNSSTEDKPSVFHVDDKRSLAWACVICKRLGIPFKCLCDRDWVMRDTEICKMSKILGIESPLRTPESLDDLVERWRQEHERVHLDKEMKDCIKAITTVLREKEFASSKWDDIMLLVQDIQGCIQDIADISGMDTLKEETSLSCVGKSNVSSLLQIEKHVGKYISYLDINDGKIFRLIVGLQAKRSRIKDPSLVRTIEEELDKLKKLELIDLKKANTRLQIMRCAKEGSHTPTQEEMSTILLVIWRIVSVQVRILDTMFHQTLPDPKSFTKSTSVVKYGLAKLAKSPSTATVDDVHRALKAANILSWRSLNLECMISHTSTDCTKLAVVTKRALVDAKVEDWVQLVNILHQHNEEFKEFETFLESPY